MQRLTRLLCLPIFLLLSLLASSTDAATLIVTSNADSGPGTLREALAVASSGDTILFDSNMTIVVANLLVVATNVTIDATGHSVVIDGNHAVGVFWVSSGSSTFIHLNIQNGWGSTGGGGITNNLGTLTIFDSLLSANSAVGTSGGGIWNSGTLTLIRTTLSGNTASGGVGSGVGGGIWNSGTLALTNSTLTGNSAGMGGGIYNSYAGILNITNSMLSGNTGVEPETQGGGIWNSGSMTLTHCIVAGNSVSGMLHTTYGGGIYNSDSATITLVDSTLSGNSAIGSFGSGYGGGIFNRGTISLTGSTLSGNSAIGGGTANGGGLWNAGNGTLTNSTLSGNSASAELALGGGIYNVSTTPPTLVSVTLSGNSVIGGIAGFGDGISNNVANTFPMSLTNTVIADSCAGAFTDNGGNLDSGTSCGFTAATSKSNATLNLGPLANNGGPTQTMLPSVGSMAIDAGIDSVCTAAPVNGVDQRGIPRPQGAHCDSGAVEVVVPQTLSVGITGNGTVSAGATPAPQSGGISNCTNAGGANCSAIYAVGQGVTLTAIVPSGEHVTWGGACVSAGSAASATVTMSAAENCTATFALNIATTTLTSLSLNSTYGQPVTFIATMTVAAPLTVLPTGTVTFLDGGSPIGTGTLTLGVATFTTSVLFAGSHAITAQYGGDGNFFASAPQPVSNTLAIAVSKKNTTVSLAAAPNPIMIGQPVTLTATVAGDPPTGLVSFSDNGTTLSCSPVTLVPGTTSSIASCTVTLTGAGSHSIVATYSGDGNFVGATSPDLVITVSSPPVTAPTLDRCALLLLGGLLSAGVFWRLRRANTQV
ncbi:Ig-like domain-containing protein [Rudaea cellulosilytica]|uniref:Ig-like domain-containing protein n=1 Tax=Rudaea cellulosilytica TaxID=540746 RepID=UPI0003A635DA|nr:Ig-like domain-containing protein [Rudaea cellulosilytica]